MLCLCNAHRSKLEGPIFHFHPYIRQLNQLAQFHDTASEGDATIIYLDRFALAQEEAMITTMGELCGIYGTLKLVEVRIAQLEEALYNQGNQPPIEPEQA